MTKQEMIEKLSKVLAEKNWENSRTQKEKDEYVNEYFLDCFCDAEDIYDAITETHHLVEKDKVEVVEGKEPPKYEYDRGAYIEVSLPVLGSKPKINKEWVL